MTDQQAISLVSTNIEIILETRSKEKTETESGATGQVYSGDFVIWEGDPLRGEGSVVVALPDDWKIVNCGLILTMPCCEGICSC